MVRVSLASLMVVSVILPISVWGDWTNHVVISEVYVNAENEFNSEWIELYNPTESEVNIGGWIIDTASYQPDVTLPSQASIPPHGYYLIGDKGWSPDNPNWINPDYSGEEITLLNNNGWVRLKKNSGEIVDIVAWGKPSQGESLERRGYGGADPNTYPTSGNGWDTDDNSSDFVIQISPNPQNSNSGEEPFITATVGKSPTSFAIGGKTVAVITFTDGSGDITIYPYPNCFPPYLASQGTHPVKRFLKIEGTVPEGQTATLRVYYEQAEFNVSDISDENTTHLGRWTGTTWEYHRASSRDTSENWVETVGVTQFSIWGIGGQDASLPVLLSSFAVKRRAGSAIIHWSTESEVEIVGWNVYRESKGKWVKINPKLIPSKGEMGGRYEFIDPNPDNPSRYMIEWVNLKGEKRRSKPITLSRSGKLKAATWAEVKTR